MRMLLKVLTLIILLGLRLSASESTVPLGIVGAEQEAFFDLVYRNETSTPVSIRQIKSSCDCVTILAHPDVVAAGAEARLTCVYRSATPGMIKTEVQIVGADVIQPAAIFWVTGFVAEKSWLVSARDLLAGSPEQRLLIDVRSTDAFRRSHALRALNLPLFSLKARAELRTQPLVLMDEGFSPEALLAEVLVLRKQGFRQVSVLAGGLAAWMRAGGAVEGLEKSAQQAAMVSAAQFERSRVLHPWLGVTVGSPLKTKQPSFSLLHAANLTDLEEKLKEWSAPVSGGLNFHPVIVLTTDAQTQAAIERQFGDSRPIYYLDGGEKALEAQQAVQLSLAHHTSQTFTTQASAPAHVGRVSAPHGCGSCGK